MKEVPRRTMESMLYGGLAAYKDQRIELLTVTVRHDSGTDLEACFYRLAEMLSVRMTVEYFAVFVKGETSIHAHILWRKPYIRMKILKDTWYNITGDVSQISNKTVVKDKGKRRDMGHLVNYLITQDIHHEGLKVLCSWSLRWLKGSVKGEQAALDV